MSTTNIGAVDKPRPLPIEPTRPFWDALAEHRILIPRCDRCDTWVWYPRPRCQSCLGNELTWTTVTGAGTVHTYTVTRQPIHPAFANSAPKPWPPAEAKRARGRAMSPASQLASRLVGARGSGRRITGGMLPCRRI